MEYWSKFMSTNESSRNKTLKVHYVCKVTFFLYFSSVVVIDNDKN